MCGCASEKNCSAFEEKGVTFVTGAQRKQEIVEKISLLYSKENCGLSFPKQTKTRAFIKVQDGCNNFCSYCIIPYLRGREKSRKVEDILGEIAECDSPEIVITGINISSYGYDAVTLTDLIKSLSPVKKRIRLGSLECNVIDEELLSALGALYDFAPQFHLSLQSGSSKVLKSMNRHYTREEYIKKCNLIYKYFPSAAITTDIIVGFATETEEDFAESLSIIEEVGFARVHAFAFSPREGTQAFKLKDLPPEIKSQRLHKLLSASALSTQKYINKFLNKPLEVIAEERDGKLWTGYTGNYIKVYVDAQLTSGKKYGIVLTSAYKDGAYAQLI